MSSDKKRRLNLITLGIFEKYPRMKCAVLEAGATWIASWLDRLNYKSEVTEAFSPIKLKPSEYFYRQCVVSADPDETMELLDRFYEKTDAGRAGKHGTGL